MDGFPIFHSIFEGNVYDSNTLEEVLLKLRENGIKDSTLVIDRGMDAKNNVLEAKKAGFDVISGVPLRGDVKRFVIDTVRNGNITDSKNAVFLSKGIIYVKEAIRDGNRLLVCVDEKRRVALKEARILAVRKAIERKMKGLPIKEGLKKYMRGNEINYSALKKAELVDSVYCILCTRKDMKKEEIIKAYFEKDRIEKAFRTLNGIVEIRPVRHWLSNRVKVHVFICYLSYLLLTVLEHKLRDSNIKDERGKLLTAERCLEELSTVYKVVMQDKLNKNTFERIVVFSKLQKKILKALGLHSQ
jgi:transposase